MGLLKHLIKDLWKEARYRKHHYYENQDYDQHYHRTYGATYPGTSGVMLNIKNLMTRNKDNVKYLSHN
jgi:hypothetical protein